MSSDGRRDVCWFCGGQLIWGCDYDLEGLGFDRDGIRIQLNCKDCNAFVEYTIFEDESPVLGGGDETQD